VHERILTRPVQGAPGGGRGRTDQPICGTGRFSDFRRRRRAACGFIPKSSAIDQLHDQCLVFANDPQDRIELLSAICETAATRCHPAATSSGHRQTRTAPSRTAPVKTHADALEPNAHPPAHSPEDSTPGTSRADDCRSCAFQLPSKLKISLLSNFERSGLRRAPVRHHASHQLRGARRRDG
jgi:hypothetical protein